MGKIPNKTLKAVNFVSAYREIIIELFPQHEQPHWVDTPPDSWLSYQRELFELATQVENKVKTRILKVLKQ